MEGVKWGVGKCVQILVENLKKGNTWETQAHIR